MEAESFCPAAHPLKHSAWAGGTAARDTTTALDGRLAGTPGDGASVSQWGKMRSGTRELLHEQRLPGPRHGHNLRQREVCWAEAALGEGRERAGGWGAQQGLTGLQKTNIRMRLVSKPPLAAVWGWPGSHIRARDSGGNPPQRGSLCRRPPAHGQC